MTTATPTRSPFAEPTRRVGGGWIALFATAWLGIWMAQLTPIQLLLPAQVEQVVGGHWTIAKAFGLAAANIPTPSGPHWINSVIAFGVISGIAGACALVTYPITGALSDRTTSRFGRRRPWILLGIVVFALSLILLGLQTNIVGVGVFWSTTIIGFCIASAATTATISDQVPVNQRGFASAWISAPQAIGTLLGLALVIFVGLSVFVGYTTVGVLLLILAIPFVGTVPDQAIRKDQRPRGGALALLQGFWINPVKYPDFGWTLLGRILVNLGNALGTTLLLYFLQFGLAMSSADAQTGLLELTGVYLFFFVLAALDLRTRERPHRPAKSLRLHLCVAAGDRRARPRLCSHLRCRDLRGGAARHRLRLLHVGRPGAGNPGAAGCPLARQGPGHHEHRDGRSAGGRPATRGARRAAVRDGCHCRSRCKHSHHAHG